MSKLKKRGTVWRAVCTRRKETPLTKTVNLRERLVWGKQEHQNWFREDVRKTSCPAGPILWGTNEFGRREGKDPPRRRLGLLPKRRFKKKKKTDRKVMKQVY